VDAVKDRSAGWEHRCPEEPIDVEDYVSIEELERIHRFCTDDSFDSTDIGLDISLYRFYRFIEAMKARG
jgi:hypothetical protein